MNSGLRGPIPQSLNPSTPQSLGLGPLSPRPTHRCWKGAHSSLSENIPLMILALRTFPWSLCTYENSTTADPMLLNILPKAGAGLNYGGEKPLRSFAFGDASALDTSLLMLTAYDVRSHAWTVTQRSCDPGQLRSSHNARILMPPIH